MSSLPLSMLVKFFQKENKIQPTELLHNSNNTDSVGGLIILRDRQKIKITFLQESIFIKANDI